MHQTVCNPAQARTRNYSTSSSNQVGYHIMKIITRFTINSSKSRLLTDLFRVFFLIDPFLCGGVIMYYIATFISSSFLASQLLWHGMTVFKVGDRQLFLPFSPPAWCLFGLYRAQVATLHLFPLLVNLHRNLKVVPQKRSCCIIIWHDFGGRSCACW